LEQLVSAALVDYPRYLDPETRQLCSPERLIEHVALQRQQRQRFAPELVAQGFSQWKKPIAQAFFAGSSLRFSRWWMPPAPTAPRVVWGRRAAPSNAPVIRVEDGFLRSVGLGADLVRPLSWVQDDMGIYFDATQPSRLEALLNHTRFDASLLLRAARLRMAVVAARLTKYNVGERRWQAPARDGRERVLVVGQVESDASIRWGGCTVTTNEDLLRAARDAHPQAQILYKPHPDVLAGLRDRRAAPGRPGWVHNAEVVADVPMADLLDQVDVVHTISSLAGFEALLRGRRVVTWGLPFYAGWGLTDDRASSASPAFARRQRRLALDELVAATLILYPTYVSRVSGAFTTAERALAELVQWREQSAPPLDRGPAARVTRQLRRQLLGWFDHFRRR
jgi:capsular polysaccharide export protein